jgi:hypothetical protein
MTLIANHFYTKVMDKKTLTLEASPDFIARLEDESSKLGMSISEFLQYRCEQTRSSDEIELEPFIEELNAAVLQAKVSLKSNLEEAYALLGELRHSNIEVPVNAQPISGKTDKESCRDRLCISIAGKGEDAIVIDVPYGELDGLTLSVNSDQARFLATALITAINRMEVRESLKLGPFASRSAMTAVNKLIHGLES